MHYHCAMLASFLWIFLTSNHDLLFYHNQGICLERSLKNIWSGE
ncbi:hypothetical protein [Nostoc linckia]|nr:hypothetical protein [Nostoc linckia]